MSARRADEHDLAQQHERERKLEIAHEQEPGAPHRPQPSWHDVAAALMQRPLRKRAA